jgi:hypothetical protein
MQITRDSRHQPTAERLVHRRGLRRHGCDALAALAWQPPASTSRLALVPGRGAGRALAGDPRPILWFPNRGVERMS